MEERKINWKDFLIGSTWKEYYFVIFVFLFYLSLVGLQCCVNFCCATKWFSYACVDIFIFSYSFPLWFVKGYWIYFPVLYSRPLLFFCSVYNSLHLPMPSFQSIPTPPCQQVWYLWVCFSFVDKFIYAMF